MLFTSTIFIGASSMLAIALIDKTAEAYGYQAVGITLKTVVTIGAMLAGVYFIEHNALLHWIGL